MAFFPASVVQKRFYPLLCLSFFLRFSSAIWGATPATLTEVRVFAAPGGTALKAHIFHPSGPRRERYPAIVIFYGGGWAAGEAGWSFGRAEHFAHLGMVAIAAEYRLSDQKNITPLEAIADAKAIVGWMRSEATSLQIDPGRIAADGWSAGAHLAACTAILPDPNDPAQAVAIPNALILVSPAVALEEDNWAKQLLLGRAAIRTISPVEHVRPGLPPTLILEGRTDTVTPLKGVQRFSDAMRAANNRCELHVYDGVGHLFTPSSLPDDGVPQPDSAVQADALVKADAFLRSLGWLEPAK